MKNQDIFEVFKHLKTLLGGNTSPKVESKTHNGTNGSPAFSPQNRSDTEKRLRDFHLNHEALARKITAANERSPLPQGTVIVLRGKGDERKTSTPITTLQKEEKSRDSTPLFPPSFP